MSEMLAEAVPSPRSVEVLARRAEPRPTAVFDTYWRFAAERQAVYFRRLRGEMLPGASCDACGARGEDKVRLGFVDGSGRCPHRVGVLVLTRDPILAEHRFTCCYRAADRVSQYLIRNVVYDGPADPREVIFRALLFKIFNKVSTWEYLVRRVLGGFGHFSWADGHLPLVVEALDEMKRRGERIYSAAYVMPSPGNAACKHVAHMRLLDKIVGEDWKKIARAGSLKALYESLLEVPSLGPFLAYQFAIDLNYSEVFGFDEDDFVVPGPGARDGLRKCFADPGGLSEPDLIRWTCDRQERELDRLGLRFESLFGRRLHLVDCQNIFCEVDKYARVAHPEVAGVSGRIRIKQRYRPDPSPLPPPFFPPKWGLEVALAPAG